MELLLETFPKLDDTAAAAIAHAFHQWWENGPTGLLSGEDEEAALVGFAAGWLARPDSDF